MCDVGMRVGPRGHGGNASEPWCMCEVSVCVRLVYV